MPRFTLIKHGDKPGEANVSVTFSADTLNVAMIAAEDFLEKEFPEVPPLRIVPMGPDQWMWDE